MMGEAELTKAVPVMRLARFVLIGAGSTLLYAALALALGVIPQFGAIWSSVTAYAIAAVFSYSGHKFLTFASAGAHRDEAPRFILATLLGLAIATAIPWTVTGALGLWPWVAVALTCVCVPITNFIVLDKWVFAKNGT